MPNPTYSCRILTLEDLEILEQIDEDVLDHPVRRDLMPQNQSSFGWVASSSGLW